MGFLHGGMDSKAGMIFKCYVHRMESSIQNKTKKQKTKGSESSCRGDRLLNELRDHMHRALFQYTVSFSCLLNPHRESSLSFPSSRNHSSSSTQRHRLLNLRNRLAGIQALRTRPRTIQDGMAAIQTHAVVQRLFPLDLVLVARVGEPAVGLEEHGGAEVFFAVPPV